MNKIWANRLIAGAKLWIDIPEYRREAVKTILQSYIASQIITAVEYTEITGEEYVITKENNEGIV